MIVDVMKHAHYKRRPRYEVSFLVCAMFLIICVFITAVGHSTFQVALPVGRSLVDFADYFVALRAVKRVIISLSEAASRLVGITLAVMRLVGNFVAVIGGGAAVILGTGYFPLRISS